MTSIVAPVRKTPSLALLAAFLAVALAGCTSGDDGGGDVLQAARDAAAAGELVLYLNVTVNGQEYTYATSDPTTPPAMQLPPSPPPLAVNATLEAAGLPDGSQADLAWSIDWGEDRGSAAAGGNSSYGGGNASANATNPEPGSPGMPGAPGAPDVNGTELPARAQHTYLREGMHHLQAALAVAGEEIHAIQVPVIVSGNQSSGIKPGSPLGNASFSEAGDLPFGLPTGCPGDGAADDLPWTFNSTVNGTPADVSRVRLVMTVDGNGDGTGLQLLDGNGTVVAESEGDGAENALEAVGPLPAGGYTVRVLGCSTLGASYTVDGTASYVAASASKP